MNNNEISISLEDIYSQKIIKTTIKFQCQNNKKTLSLSIANSSKINYTKLKSDKADSSVVSLQCHDCHIIKISNHIFFNYPNLIVVSLKRNNLQKISKNFLDFRLLSSLYLDFNEIEQIPSWISEMTNLTTLSISFNDIGSFPIPLTKLSNLKYLNLSYNKIESIPSEIQAMKSLENLFIFSNYFDKLPTSIAFLKNLNHISLDWFEFADLGSNEKNINQKKKLQQTIDVFKNILAEKNRVNEKECSFIDYIQQLSFRKNLSVFDGIKDSTQLNDLLTPTHLFYAVKMKYFGPLKSYISFNKNFMQIKNESYKSLLYTSITTAFSDLTKLFLNNVEPNSIENIQYYIFKAIKEFNYPLFLYFLEKIKPSFFTFTDSNGNNCYHILLYCFYKNVPISFQIGEKLVENTKCSFNEKNYLGWSPIHVGIKKGKLQALHFMHMTNKWVKVNRNDEKGFDFEKKGKNDWTPLHLAVNDYKIPESIFLVNIIKVNIFIKNGMNLTPRGVADGNYLLSRFLIREEEKVLFKKYILDDKSIILSKSSKKNSPKKTNANHLLLSKHQIIKKTNSTNLRYIQSTLEQMLNEVIDELRGNHLRAQILMSELCGVILNHKLTTLIPFMEKALVFVADFPGIKREIENTIKILELFEASPEESNMSDFFIHGINQSALFLDY